MAAVTYVDVNGEWRMMNYRGTDAVLDDRARYFPRFCSLR